MQNTTNCGARRTLIENRTFKLIHRENYASTPQFIQTIVRPKIVVIIEVYFLDFTPALTTDPTNPRRFILSPYEHCYYVCVDTVDYDISAFSITWTLVFGGL